MILIYTNTDDFTVDYFILYLQKIGQPFYRVNTDQFPHELRATWQIDRDVIRGKFEGLAGILDFNDITSIWYRKPIFTRKITESVAMNHFITREVQASIEGIIRSLPVRFVSRPEAIYHAEHKLVQLNVALSIGFAIPETMLTSRPVDGLSFLQDQNRIIKPVKSGRIIENNTMNLLFTTPITYAQFLQRVDSLNATPAYLQKQIDKKLDIRVTVFGSRCFSVAIHSQENQDTKTDWRKGQAMLRQTVWDIPNEVEEMCVQLVQTLGLSFGAIDLVLDKQNTYWFLEINPTGQWAWLEQELGLPMCEALFNALEGSY